MRETGREGEGALLVVTPKIKVNFVDAEWPRAFYYVTTSSSGQPEAEARSQALLTSLEVSLWKRHL